MDAALTPAAAIFGNIQILRIARELPVPSRARAPDDAKNFLRAGEAAVSREQACGLTQQHKQIWRRLHTNTVAAAHTGMQIKGAGGVQWARGTVGGGIAAHTHL